MRVVRASQRTQGAPPRPRRKLTPVQAAGKVSTYTAPVSDPGGRERPQSWDLYSRDGLWHYERQDDGGSTPWAAVFLPTGQRREHFGTVADARAATYGAALVERLRREAFAAALRTGPDGPRATGHRAVAVHLRLAGLVDGHEAEHRCRCGGYLAVITRRRDLGHLDACEQCYTPGEGLPTALCVRAANHRFCGDPQPVE